MQGKASGALCLLTLFGQANKVRRPAGRNPPVLNLNSPEDIEKGQQINHLLPKDS